MRQRLKWFILTFKVYKISGDSMLPALNDGDYVVTTKPRSFRPGSIYVVNHLDLGQIIKRLIQVDENRLIFSGDNPDSTPSSVIAPVSPDRVLGQVRFVIGKTGIKRSPPLLNRRNEHSEA